MAQQDFGIGMPPVGGDDAVGVCEPHEAAGIHYLEPNHHSNRFVLHPCWDRQVNNPRHACYSCNVRKERLLLQFSR